MAKINQKKPILKKRKPLDKTKIKTVQPTDASGKATSKKTKRQNKTSSLLNKLKTSNDAKETIRKANQTPKAIIGSVNPLLAALCDIDLTKPKVIREKKQQPKGKKKHSSEKKRNNADMKDIDLFKKVTEHEKFISCPQTAIKDHIKHILEMEMQCDKI